MERVHPRPAHPVLQGKTGIFPKLLVKEVSRAIRRFAPDYYGNFINDEPQVPSDNIRYFVSIALVGFRPAPAHGALLQMGARGTPLLGAAIGRERFL